MTHPIGIQVTAGGQMGTIDSDGVDPRAMENIIGYHVIWDDGSWTLESPDAIDVVER